MQIVQEKLEKFCDYTRTPQLPYIETPTHSNLHKPQLPHLPHTAFTTHHNPLTATFIQYIYFYTYMLAL